jgi:hypothetical protein
MKHIPEERRFYHRWGYDPMHDDVHLNDDNDYDHNGYVYRIDGGWRITDQDHDAVGDPYITRKIMELLRGDQEENVTPNDYDFNQLHYGHPLPRKGK